MNVHYEPNTPPTCKLGDLNTGDLFILAEESCNPQCVCVVTAEPHGAGGSDQSIRRLNDGGITYLCTATKVLQVKIDEITVSLSSAGGGCGCG